MRLTGPLAAAALAVALAGPGAARPAGGRRHPRVAKEAVTNTKV